MSSPFPYPPSSAPGGTPTADRSSLQSRPALDPRDYDDVHGLGGSRRDNDRGERTEAQEGEDIVQRPPRRAGNIDISAIPRVKDTTGEKVLESFRIFLETWVKHEQ
jgi:DNA replication licensing factor MCM6